MKVRMAVDIGGTFTDLVALKGGQIAPLLGKELTTPENFANGVSRAIEKSRIDPAEIDHFVHGTTVVINALTERRGAKVALITTRGFRDVIEIQRANRTDMYNLFYRKPRPFVPRRYRFEVPERVSHRGEIIEPLDESSLDEILQTCAREDIEAVAVCYLHAYANPVHEKRTRQRIERFLPGASVTASHELSQQWREYERTNTAVMNAYVKPVASAYLGSLDRQLADRGVSANKHLMQSNGGATSFRQGAEQPIHLVESGPVGGVIGAALLAGPLHEPNLISFDMGGTTAKVSLIERSGIKINTEYHLERSAVFAGYPLQIPVVDIVEVGAGGGSIASVDAGGALHVGPRSAGAKPGPACYGLGGTEPTVTDANLVTGRLSPDYFLGGEMRLDVHRAERAIARIAEAFDLTIAEAALGILRLANANMQAALERVSIERGYDPRDFALVASGGAGGLHGAALARELKLRTLIIPNAPGQFSAWGMLMTDLRRDYVRTRILACVPDHLDIIRAELRDLTEEAREQSLAEGFPPDSLWTEQSLDLRYAGQEHAVRTPVHTDDLDETDLAALIGRFHGLHQRAYSFRQDDPVEIVNLHVTAWGRVDKPDLPRASAEERSIETSCKGRRPVIFEGVADAVETPVFERTRLPIGEEIPGPAVVEEPASTTIVYPGQLLTVDEYGHLIIREEAACR